MAAAPTTNAPIAAPTVAPSALAGLHSQILKQGKPAAHVPSHAPLLGKPGNYKVIHGSVTLGYDLASGERVIAHPGAHIKLSAEEAGPLCAAKTVERLDDE